MKILMFIFLWASLYADYGISVCSIFKNEAPFLKEWIEFHKLQGVEHFFLYNNNSEDDYEEVLRPYLLSEEVTLINWPLRYISGITRFSDAVQVPAYSHCLKEYTDKTQWLAFIDIDEFLFCPTGITLTSFLERYQTYGGVCVNWLLFGTSEIETIPEGSLMIEWLTQCSKKDDDRHQIIKSVIQPRFVKKCVTPHAFQYISPYFAVNAEFKTVHTSNYLHAGINRGPSVTHDLIRINHYWTRAKDTFASRKIPSRCDRRPYENENNLSERAAPYNATTDTAILQFTSLLRERVFGSSK